MTLLQLSNYIDALKQHGTFNPNAVVLIAPHTNVSKLSATHLPNDTNRSTAIAFYIHPASDNDETN